MSGWGLRRSGALVNDALETIFSPLFHTASPIQPPPLRGTSFHRKELPSVAWRGWLPFFAAKPPPLCLPPWERCCVEKSGILVSQPSPLGKGDRAAVDRVLSQTAYLRRSPSLSFIPLPISNLRPFGAPPSIGRRECPREPFPLEGAAERSEAGLASFLGGEAASSLTFPLGKSLCREKRYPPIAPFPTRGRLCRGYCFSTHAAIL